MATFIEKLNRACYSNRSLLCIGLDPDPSRIPTPDVYTFNRLIIEATQDLVCAYKPNLAFYEALGLDGLKDLKRTVEYIRNLNKNILIIGDAKRGDIESSGQAYARAMFEQWDFDVITINAYGGRDSIRPYLEYENRGVFVWCRSSNSGSKDLQDVEDTEGAPLYQRMAKMVQSLNEEGNLGLIAGATYPSELKSLRRLCPDIPFLIPGIGTQSGNLEKAVKFGVNEFGKGAIINSSRGIIYASAGPDFADAARKKAELLRHSINVVLTQEEKRWY